MNEEIKPIEQNEVKPEITQENQVVGSVPTEESSKNIPNESFKMMREQLDRERREKEEYIKRLSELEYETRLRQQTVNKEDDDIQVEIPSEYDTVEAKHVKQLNRKQDIQWKKAEEHRQKIESTIERLDAENRILREVPNYYDIVTAENVEKLEKEMPVLANTIAKSKSQYELKKATAEAIQKFIMQDKSLKSKEAELKNADEKINKNLDKPLPSTGGSGPSSSSPLSKANAFAQGGLTQEEKDFYWKEWNKKNGNKFLNFK